MFSTDFAVQLGITMPVSPPLQYEATEAWMVDPELYQHVFGV